MPSTFSEDLTSLWMAQDYNFVRVRSFRKCALAGIPLAANESYQDGMRTPQMLIEMGFIINEPEKFLSEENKHEIGKMMAASAVERNQAAIDAATLVFAHSIVDDVATRCCRMTSLIEPMGWMNVMKDKQLKISELSSKSFEVAYAERLAEHMKEVAKRSLPDRIVMLNANCQPVPPYKRDGVVYQYDAQRLADLDTLRHEVVHQIAITKPMVDMDADLNFLGMTAQYLIWLVMQKYSIRLNGEQWIQNKLGKAAS